ncbi:sensor domain-containing protein [Marinomonas transparens]|uniref:cyclic-guanylate-specific phosphodiesterase n=1 Tax=Marinomonas transparens TaxID=2795388 RepID=A0A934N3C3_9GAMM|nr:EAL domain-containing protein [Marinomonas transparens]MBJ7538823.1 EAL domain-containing protein [Marinomonas transparens]
MIDLSKLLSLKMRTAVWIIDIEHSTIPWCNKAAEILLEDSLTEIESGNRAIGGSLKKRLLTHLERYDEGSPLAFKWHFIAKDGTHYNCHGSVVSLSDGRKGLAVEAHPVIDQALPVVTHLDDPLLGEEGIFKRFKTLPFAIFDSEGNSVSCSERFVSLFGDITNLRGIFEASSAANSFVERLAKQESLSQEIRLLTLDGVRWHRIEAFSDQISAYTYLLVDDIQEARDHEVALFKLHNYDNLTSLPNRNLLYQQLEKALINAKKRNRQFGLLYLDLDGFKVINDTFGHRVGDELIQRVAERVKGSIPTRSCLYRLGGDEFVVVLENVESIEELEDIAKAIMSNAISTYPVAKMEMMITSSIGIACYPQHANDIDSLLKNADAAMYQAKSMGHNMYFVYENRMAENINAHLTLGGGLRKAIDEEEFELYYQPKIRLSDETTVGAEALIRWFHPELGMISPDNFIPLAEESGLILPLGEWVIRRACRQLQEWRELGYPPICVSVNLSGRQFMQTNLVDMVKQVLDETGVDPKYLELELTESMLMADGQQTIVKLHNFRKLGLTLSIDDFGTGYSSLAYLKKFPIQALKIDRSFIKDLGVNCDDNAIVKASIVMAHSLNLKVVAEGVEKRSQVDILKEYKCDEIQGYYFAKPMSSQDFLGYMDSHTMFYE